VKHAWLIVLRTACGGAARPAFAGLAIALAACEGNAPPSQMQPAPVHAMVDAQPVDASIDAAIAACAGVHTFRFGTLSVPDGWCWQRSGEGDDQSGTVFDDKHHVQLTYAQMSFDENVGDVCAGKPARDVRVGAVRYAVCELGDGRTCASFRGAANVCGDAIVLESVLRTLAPGKR
jgi:hypothetical protein